MSEYSLIESPNNGASVLRRDGDNQVVVAGGLNADEAKALVAKLNRHTFRIGDAFEWIAAGGFVAAGYIQYRSLPLALTVGAVTLAYFAQCYAAAEFPRPRLPRFRIHRPQFVLVKSVLAKVASHVRRKVQ